MINVEAKQKHVGNVAKRDPHHRFTGLYRTLCEETWLTEAWQRIRRNKGSKTAGVDGQTKDDVDDALIKRLAAKLRKEEFQPTPVRRVYIPKLNGKKRPLGISDGPFILHLPTGSLGIKPLLAGQVVRV